MLHSFGLNGKEGKARILIGFALCVLVSLSLTFSQMGDRLSRKLLDRQFVFLRDNFPKPVGNDVVIVGIDESTFKSFKEPYELWHPHWAVFLKAMTLAKPKVVGIDVALPERSYDFLVPQYDRKLADSLRTLSAGTPIVLGQTLDENGNFRQVFPPFVEAAGGNALVTTVVCTDADGVARRADPNQCTVNAEGATLTESMAAYLGGKGEKRGGVDFAIGEEFHYVPFHKVLEWAEHGENDQLHHAFSGRPVLVGFVLPFEGRVRLPVVLAAWEPETRNLPAVVWQAQTLRSMLTQGMLKEFELYLVLTLSLLATVLWFARLHWYKFAVLVGFPVALLAYSTWLLTHSIYLPVGGILLSGLSAFGFRSLYELYLKGQENKQLRGLFSSSVSAETLKALIDGNVQSRLEGERKRVCILYASIHDFGARCENDSPQDSVAVLNEFFLEMTAAIHQHDGTVGKFMGDAVMAYFGAPQLLECPERNALEAAQEMLLRVRQINAGLKEKGGAAIRVGVGLHVGNVVIGHVGSETRHEYTALGEVVSVAIKLEALSQSCGFPVVCSKSVGDSVELAGGMTELGAQIVKEGVTITVCGWYPPLLAAN